MNARRIGTCLTRGCSGFLTADPDFRFANPDLHADGGVVMRCVGDPDRQDWEGRKTPNGCGAHFQFRSGRAGARRELRAIVRAQRKNAA